MYEYLNDMDFLMKLDKAHVRTHYAKVTLLSFDEKPVHEIQGNITAGTLNVNGSSAVRRTISLTMLANENNSDLQNVENEISIKRKVKVAVGFKNPLASYAHYGDIIWFPCGVFILSAASVQRSTSGWSISISGKDKMAQLDGTVGGVLPASVTFHERYIQITDKLTEIEYPTIQQIIFETVTHWGGEPAENVIISDLDEEVKMLVRYMGDRPIYFSDGFKSLSFNAKDFDLNNKYSHGENVGYKMTDFTYPGELVLKAGDTVVTLLDKVVSVLGNYEYFYDIDGRFIFQEIKNYLNTYSPLVEYYDATQDRWVDPVNEDNYVKTYDNKKFLYSLTDLDTTTAIAISPKLDNIKNDFYVWGQRKTVSGIERPIRYHLAIDTKPDLDWATVYMWEVSTTDPTTKVKTIVRYDRSDSNSYTVDGYTTTLVGPPCDEWREELYRRALDAQVTNGVYDNYYDSELLAEWRKLYDPTKESWMVTNQGKTTWWNPDVVQSPEKLDFWLDFIDTGAEVGKYAIGEIGRRTKVVNDTKITSIYNKEVPDIVFIKQVSDPAELAEVINYTRNSRILLKAYSAGVITLDEMNNPTWDVAREALIYHYTTIGQQYFFLTPQYYDLFSISTTGTSCFDEIRNMMYQNLSFNTTIQITCLPKYYIEPNNIIYIEDRDTGIAGNYQITQFSLPLAYNGTMSITATEALTRV